MKGKTRFGKGNKAGMPGMMKESDPREKAQDKKLAAKNKMSMQDWEESSMDRLHDSGAKQVPGFAMGGAPMMGAPAAPALPDPRMRIPQTKGVTAPPAGGAPKPQQPQQPPAMKHGGGVKCMKQGGVTSAEMKKVGRNLARVANQKSPTKPQAVPSAATKKSGSAIIKGTKKGWGIARGR